MEMRWPKDFVRVSGQTVRFANSKVYIHQYNSGKNKNFVVEKRGLPAWQQNTWTIAGKGDEAMERAICKARELA